MAVKRDKLTVGAPERAIGTERDFHGWLLDQASALRGHRADSLDWQNLAEELEAMARKDRNALRSHLQNLLCHLLKWRYQPDHRTISWVGTINISRDHIHDLIEESPSLRNVLESVPSESKAYRRAVRDATLETAHRVKFPRQSPWPLDRILDPEFLPE